MGIKNLHDAPLMRIILNWLDARFETQDNMSMNTLTGMQVGERGIISGFHAKTNSYRQHLLAMGFTPGTPFILQRIAPLGDPIVIQIRGVEICLRRKEAQEIHVQKCTLEEKIAV